MNLTDLDLAVNNLVSEFVHQCKQIILIEDLMSHTDNIYDGFESFLNTRVH